MATEGTLVTLRGFGDGSRDAAWEMQVIRGHRPICNLCYAPVDYNDPDAGWKLHSGSPVCGDCIRAYQVKEG